MSKVVLDVIVVLIIITIGGFFAGSEMALVSLREGQVKALAKRGRRGQRAARLAQDPNRFFSAVQIGVTLATLFSGAYGAETLAGYLKSWLAREYHLSPVWAGTIAFIVVTICITFFSLVLGELAPKRIALQRAPALALLAAPLLDRIAVLARPVVWLLTKCTNLIVALLGGDPRLGRLAITEEELRDLVTGAQTLSQDERHIVGEVFDAGKRQIREVLVPRTEVVFLDAETQVAEAAAIVAGVPHSRLPVYQDTYDNVIGFVHVRDLFSLGGDQGGRSSPRGVRGDGSPREREDQQSPGVAKDSVPVRQISRPVKYLPISKTVLSSLSEMRRERAHLAIVVDEYGGTAGIVTLEDLVRGADRRHHRRVRHRAEPRHPAASRRRGGRRPAQPGRVRRADRPRAARGPVRDRRGLRPGRPRRAAVGGRHRPGGRPDHHRDRTRRPPHRPPARHSQRSGPIWAGRTGPARPACPARRAVRR